MTMTEAVGGGAALAWRLLATLEGGSLILATSALLAYTARNKAAKPYGGRPVHTVLVTNTTNSLGKELKVQLESRGCTVTTLSSGATGEADKVDALVIVGAEPHTSGLDGISELISEDVYANLKLLDSLSPMVHRDGYMAWACAGSTSGAFRGAAEAFDDVIHASLQHAAKASHCKSIWVGRCKEVTEAAEQIVAALLPCTITQASRFSVRHAASKVRGYIGRWLKIVT